MTTFAELAERERQTAPELVGQDIAILDIERIKGRFTGEFFDLNDYKSRRIHPDDVIEWPRTICLAYRWYGEEKIHFLAEWQPGGWEQMHREVWNVYDRAQIVVGHNVVNFDSKKLLGGWAQLGLGEPSPWKSADTLTYARRLGYESNTLGALCDRFGIPSKKGHYDADVARAAADGDAEAQAIITDYNCGDVEASTWLYDRLRGHMPGHPHVMVPGEDGDTLRCNQCRSTNLERTGIRLANRIAYTLYRCRDCSANVSGSWHSRVARTLGVAGR